jgi:hypothetical protein
VPPSTATTLLNCAIPRHPAQHPQTGNGGCNPQGVTASRTRQRPAGASRVPQHHVGQEAHWDALPGASRTYPGRLIARGMWDATKDSRLDQLGGSAAWARWCGHGASSTTPKRGAVRPPGSSTPPTTGTAPPTHVQLSMAPKVQHDCRSVAASGRIFASQGARREATMSVTQHMAGLSHLVHQRGGGTAPRWCLVAESPKGGRQHSHLGASVRRHRHVVLQQDCHATAAHHLAVDTTRHTTRRTCQRQCCRSTVLGTCAYRKSLCQHTG